jgi:hypothetical protein
MSGAGQYELSIIASDDEVLRFTIPLRDQDGNAFPHADYSLELSIGYGGWPTVALTEGDGLTIDTDTGDVEVRYAPALTVGTYDLGLRATEIATGDTIMLADGPLTIKEGNF